MSCFKILWILILSISTQIVYGHQKINDPNYDVNLSILDPENLTTIRLDIIDIEENEDHHHNQRSKSIEIDLGDGTKNSKYKTYNSQIY